MLRLKKKNEMFYLDTITKAECYHNYPFYAYIVKGNNSILVYCTVCFSRSLTQCIYICILLIHNEKCTECFSNNVSHRFVMRIINIVSNILSQIRNENYYHWALRSLALTDS